MHSVRDYVIYKDILIILLDVPLEVKSNTNVFAYDIDGNKLWQIENLFPNDNDCPYNLIKIDENELLHLYNWCGFIIKLDPITGEVKERRFTK